MASIFPPGRTPRSLRDVSDPELRRDTASRRRPPQLGRCPPGVRPDGAVDGPLEGQLRPAQRRHPVSVRLGPLQDTAPTLNPQPAPKGAKAGRGLRAGEGSGAGPARQRCWQLRESRSVLPVCPRTSRLPERSASTRGCEGPASHPRHSLLVTRPCWVRVCTAAWRGQGGSGGQLTHEPLGPGALLPADPTLASLWDSGEASCACPLPVL